ncbi:ABC transporter ATP-binding protein [Parageobacillus thermoglucosidasius]|uniref:ABC transporter ATP-binding protein n=1 Tax=Parageobacillus thermoglucosidasius TaxID=1426 RepID=UPI000E199E9F|nr:ABC transporter ATP-binding protein [Parageobacillus thermoglucosidasius]MED4904070.1 ABC transporter ATP-binding protein [Parageobacillus thermoglucosidasius]MED4915549.1 ABC transporter ATP-binding protein [Parageobacillus thermoglucosidasius]MED4946327.1 ABC transporter ATP-binding protein [Parageobacillus thermoglucosidasius]MED4982903.1 ABC transporter ATP-binding protein [Parageobacillus thermoglucosidasius]RDE28469.1 ABC transporter ATP-binding protein [Parageobacillus thermoglucosid
MKKNHSMPLDNWKPFWELIKSTNPPKWIFVTAVILSLIETGVGLIVPWFTKSLVDQIAASAIEPSIIILLAASFIAQTITSGFSYYFLTYIGEYVVAAIRKKLWNQVLLLPVPFFDKHQSGETMSRITQDTNTVKMLITQHLVTFLTGFISVAGAVSILLIIDWKMTLMMVTAVPVSILILWPLGQKMYKISKATQDEMASFSANLGRVLSDIRLVKAYCAEKEEQKNGELGIFHLFQFGLKEARIQAVISPFMTFVMMLVLVVLIGYGGVRVASGTLSSGSLVAIIIYMVQIVVPFSQMAAFFTSFQKAMGATERIQRILSLEKEPSGSLPAVPNHKQDIHFRNVSFSYKKKGEPVLKQITLTIPSGKTTAIVGPSGAGKTTLFALLERFYTPDEGEILLGETNIEDFDLYSWRSQIGYVSQESPMMSGTIRDNICYGLNRDVSDEEIERAAKLANAAEFIERLPNRYLTEAGERGIKLSGGQRQRIAIARALIRNPKILLLDEATSNLDSSSEVLVQKALQRLMEGRTTLVIAHRLSTVVNADQIVVLENGTITGIGTHSELLQTHPLYRELAEQQLQTILEQR